MTTVTTVMDQTKILLSQDTDVSPVTLSSDWSRVARLLLLASLAVFGSVGNVFMISAVMVEDHLKRRGIIFLIIFSVFFLIITISNFCINLYCRNLLHA